MTTTPPRNCPNCGATLPAHAAFCGICGQSLKATTLLPALHPAAKNQPVSAMSPTGLLPTAHLLKERYHILKQIGKGGFGAVYQAIDTHIGNRAVAVKEMSQSGLGPQEIAAATEAFKREVFLLAGLKHPNLPGIYDYFSDGGRWYVVMEFIAGKTLEDYMKNAGMPFVATQISSVTATSARYLPLEKSLEIAIQLCTVLDYLHTLQPPIIFRDLKPANVMLNSDGHVYLIDFGIARHFKPGQARDTIALGSPGYAAPEQYGKAQTTPRSDIYSLGALLHQMLTGNDPSFAPFRFGPLRLQGSPGIPPLQETALETLLMQMLDMDANKRPTGMALVKQELVRIANEYTSKSARVVYTLSPILQPVKPALPLGVCVSTQRGYAAPVRAVAWSPDSTRIASGSEDGVVQMWRAEDGEDPNGRKVASFANHSGCVYAVAWSPDGTRIASAGRDKTVQVWNVTAASRWLTPFASLIGSKVFSYRGHTDGVRAVAWSPDGQYIASASNDHTVRVWHAITGHTIATYRGHSSWVYAAEWSPDGTLIASAGRDKRVRIWDAATGTHMRSYRGHSSVVRAIAWSPDGQYIASAGNDKTIQVWLAGTRDLICTLHGHADYVNSLVWHPAWGAGKPTAVSRGHRQLRIISGSNDKTVIMWDIVQNKGAGASGRHLFSYCGHSSWVWAVACSPDGTRIASASDDKTVQVWGAG